VAARIITPYMLSAVDAAFVSRNPEVPGLRLLLDGDALAEVLHREAPHLGVTAVHPEFLRFEPGRDCVCACEGVTSHGTVLMYAKAFHQRSREKLHAWHAGASEGSSALRAANDRWQVGIALYPGDRQLNDLPRLHHPRLRRRLLGTVLAGAREWHRTSLHTVRYEPERRYTARITRDGEPVAVLKMYDARGFFAARTRARLLAQAGVPGLPPLVGEAARSGILSFAWQPGTSLGDLLPVPGTVPFRAAGRALARLHGHAGASWVPPALAPAVALIGAAGIIANVAPSLGGRAQQLAAGIAPELAPPGAALAWTYGSFSPQNVAIDGPAAWLLDGDRCCSGIAAADLGSFAAHLDREVLRGRLTTGRRDEAVDAVLAGYAEYAPPPSSALLRLHTAAALLRLAPHAFRHREPEWHDRMAATLDRVSALRAPRAQAVRRERIPPMAAAEIAADAPPRAARRLNRVELRKS
jgi:hypothetical protein